MFFAPRDSQIYPPCGMFTAGHIISSAIFIAVAVIAIILTLKTTDKAFNLIIKVLAIVFLALEIGKIIYNFSYGYTYIDAWVPLAYCSLFIYSLFLSGFAKGKLKSIGNTFLAVSTYAGLFFMIFPTTSLMLHPLFHFLCMHSLLYHSAMLYVGFTIILKGLVKPSYNSFISYVCYLAFFSAIAITINLLSGSNLMFYTQPYNMPIKLVVDVYNLSKPLYTAFIFIAYSALYLFFILTYTLIKKLRRKPYEL